MPWLSHELVIAFYVLLPPTAFALALSRARRAGSGLPIARFLFTATGASLLGIGLYLAYGLLSRGRLLPTQAALAGYFSASVFIFLNLFDRLLRKFSLKIFRAGHQRHRFRKLAAGLLRVTLLFGLGLPYIVSLGVIYRMKVAPKTDPFSLFELTYESVTFPATDGVSIAAWWMPTDFAKGDKTALICPGFSGGRERYLNLAKPLIEGGYNVLLLDFRAQGESGGQLSTFGNLERRDVLGAIHWLRETHSHACGRVVGVGFDTGAAALIAAAADLGDDGQGIDAVAAIGAFDRVDRLVESFSNLYFIAPLRWLVQNIGLPIAGLHTGSNLAAFDPAKDAQQLWPRPLLVIHSLLDEMVPFERGQALFDQALQPRYDLWLERGSHRELQNNPDVGKVILRFFDSAKIVL